MFNWGNSLQTCQMLIPKLGKSLKTELLVLFSCVYQDLDHFYNIAGMYVLGRFSTTEYVIKCVESICSAVLWAETRDYGLVSLSPVGLWFCKKITTLIFIHPE